MSISWAIVVVASLAVLFALRRPYLPLALHMDTGFYVSNATVTRRRPMIAAGWNARYAGGSKLIPELFYTLVFLMLPGQRYKRSFRVAEIVLHALTAGAAYGALLWVGAGPVAAGGAALSFLALSSEPDYGSYFECAEHFEPIFHFVAFAAITMGIWKSDPLILGIGVIVLAVDIFFVKLSSAVGAAIVGLAILIASPVMVLPGLLALGVVLAFFAVWIYAVGRTPAELIRPLFRHEQVSRRFFVRYRDLLLSKGTLLRDILIARPLLPILAMYGYLASGQLFVPLTVFSLAILAIYFMQAAVVWYYAYLVLGPLAMSAGIGAANLLTHDHGVMAVALIAAAWLAQHVFDSYVRRRRDGDEKFARHVWRLSNPEFGSLNLRVETAAGLFAPQVRGNSVFVVGPFNQLYVLLEAAYVTPIVSVAYWLDIMDRGWREELLCRFLSDPPDLMVDSDASFDAAALAASTGLVYARASEAPGLVLYRFAGRADPTDPKAEPFLRHHWPGDILQRSGLSSRG